MRIRVRETHRTIPYVSRSSTLHTTIRAGTTESTTAGWRSEVMRILAGGHRKRIFLPYPCLLGYQQVLSGTQDPLSSMDHVNQLRQRVEEWRQKGYPGAGVTEVTLTLLRYWEDPERSVRLYFAQLDAIRTIIYLTEAAPEDPVHEFLVAVNSEYNDNIRRWAVKMATGVGKTVVMAMTVLWQAANRWEYAADERFHQQVRRHHAGHYCSRQTPVWLACRLD